MSGGGTQSCKARDLFFPKPFNDEQVRIVQLLEVSDGVVVQGPPGTGKTHTIANVISHYLANGKRVLVTSMKDPALAVLRDQLQRHPTPSHFASLDRTRWHEAVRACHPQDCVEVQAIDRTATAREVQRIETTIDALHGGWPAWTTK